MTEMERDRRWERGEGYNRYITSELSSFRKQAWKKQIGKHFKEGMSLEVLDVGTGPGFFACILSEEGHRITGIDKSEGMLECARENAKKLQVSPTFMQMDLNRLSFEDACFDAIVMRNVTWTLEHPEEVYAVFKRVLRPGGMLLIYDANWHMQFFDPEIRSRVLAREQHHFEKYGVREVVSGEDLEYFGLLPLSNTLRPQWDVEALKRLGLCVETEEDIGRFVYEPWEKDLYAESPLFEICAVKQTEDRERKVQR